MQPVLFSITENALQSDVKSFTQDILQLLLFSRALTQGDEIQLQAEVRQGLDNEDGTTGISHHEKMMDVFKGQLRSHSTITSNVFPVNVTKAALTWKDGYAHDPPH